MARTGVACLDDGLVALGEVPRGQDRREAGIALAVVGFTHPFMPGHIASGVGLLVAGVGFAAAGFAGAGWALLRMSDDDFDRAPGRPA
ncbi:hypothetical protein [Streptomyces sp. NPDC087437]|uniref:hypothetical protein n=1 Tax=Streptomyces sp. NPDC087437 TaxID=3365789 RepID=UPI0037F246CC